MIIRRTAALLAATCVATVVLLGCSSSGNKDAEASTCTTVKDLRTSVDGLKNVDFLQTGLDGLQKQVDEIEKSVDELKSSSKDQFGSQVDALKASFDTLSDTLSKASEDGDSIMAVADQLQQDFNGITKSWSELEQAARSELGSCDLTTASS